VDFAVGKVVILSLSVSFQRLSSSSLCCRSSCARLQDWRTRHGKKRSCFNCNTLKQSKI